MWPARRALLAIAGGYAAVLTLWGAAFAWFWWRLARRRQVERLATSCDVWGHIAAPDGRCLVCPATLPVSSTDSRSPRRDMRKRGG